MTTEPNGKGPRGPFLRLVGGVSALIEFSGKVIAAACLAFMFVALLVNVVLRYVAGSGIAWAYEIHNLLLPWLVAGGVVVAAARGRNIAILLLPELLKGWPRTVLLLAVQAAILVIAITVLKTAEPILRAAQYQNFSSRTLTGLGLKQIWGYYSLIYAFTAMAAVAVLDMLRILVGEDPLDHDPEHAPNHSMS